MNEMEYAAAYFGEFKVKGDEIIPKYCPFCNGGQHRDTETFALNYKKHTFNCKRGSCGRQGHFSELCRSVGEFMDRDETENVMRSFETKHKKKYKVSDIRPEKPSSKIEEYLKLRGISSKTAEVFGIGEDGKGNMVFPFYRTKEDFENKKPTFNKFRRPCKHAKGKGPKMWREEGTEPILFGMHLCTQGKPLIITEGEFDCMAAYECGAENCVSIPSGTNDFEWLDTCHDFVEGFHTIIFMGDNDEAGRKFIETASKKLNHHDVMVCDMDTYGEAKDCNEILFRRGQSGVQEVINSARRLPLYGVKDLADVRPLDLSKAHKTTTGFGSFDEKFGGMLDGDMTIISGEPGAGKSTLMSQIMNHNIERGEKVCVYSGELPDEQYVLWAMLQAAGEEHIKYETDETGHVQQTFENSVIDAIHDWWRGKYFLYDLSLEDADKWNRILEVFEAVYKRYDVKTFLIDNLLTVDSKDLDKDKYEAQDAFIRKFSVFCKKLGVHGYLVVHPVKSDSEKVTKMSQISGSATITRMANNIISVNRAGAGADYDTELCVIKSRMFGITGAVKLKFNKKSKQFAELNADFPKFSWQKKFKPIHIARTNKIEKRAGADSDDFGMIIPKDEELPF